MPGRSHKTMSQPGCKNSVELWFEKSHAIQMKTLLQEPTTLTSTWLLCSGDLIVVEVYVAFFYYGILSRHFCFFLLRESMTWKAILNHKSFIMIWFLFIYHYQYCVGTCNINKATEIQPLETATVLVSQKKINVIIFCIYNEVTAYLLLK